MVFIELSDRGTLMPIAKEIIIDKPVESPMRTIVSIDESILYDFHLKQNGFFG
jgi:hypothetical protein